MRLPGGRLHGLLSRGALVAAAAVLFFVAWRAWRARPLEVTVEFSAVHGLERDAPVRVRGARVGSVGAVRPSREGVEVVLRIDRGIDSLAREGARFWIARPEIGPEGVFGLETVLGPRYVVAEPGEGAEKTRFRGEEEPPLGGLGPPESRRRLRLRARNRGGLRPGAAITYRGVLVGRIVSVDLRPDGAGVAIEAVLRGDRAGLLRPGTVFVRDRGLRSDVLMRVLRWEIGGRVAEAAVGDSLALYVPADDFLPAPADRVFEVADELPDGFREAEALLLDPAQAPACSLEVRRARRPGRGLFARGALEALVVEWAGAFAGPAELLDPAGAGEDSVLLLDPAGGEPRRVALAGASIQPLGPGCVLLTPPGSPPAERPFRPQVEVEGALFAFPAGRGSWPVPLGSAPTAADERVLLPLRHAEPLLGAPVLNERGRWVGILVVVEGRAVVSLLPPP